MEKGRKDQLNHFSITRPICLILEIGLLPLRTELKLSKSITVKRALCLKGVPSPSCKLGAGSSLLQLYFCQSINLISRQGTLSKKNTTLFGNSSQHGGVGLPNSQNFCKFTKYFFVCQIHSEVLKHVLQRGGGDI